MRPPKKGKFQSLKARMQGPRANHRHGESGTEQNNRLRESSIVFLVLAGGSRNEDGGAGGTRPWPSLCLNNGRGGGAIKPPPLIPLLSAQSGSLAVADSRTQTADYKYETIDEDILKKPRGTIAEATCFERAFFK